MNELRNSYNKIITCTYLYVHIVMCFTYYIACSIVTVTFISFIAQNLTIQEHQCTNDTVLLICRGVQFTDIEWSNENSRINSSVPGRYIFRNNRTVLEIHNITQYDNGSVITCGDANSSSISNPVTIIVYSKCVYYCYKHITYIYAIRAVQNGYVLTSYVHN